MNIYEHDEPVFGMRADFENFQIFSSATCVFMFIMLHIVHKFDYAKRFLMILDDLSNISIYLMNQM